MELKMSDKTYDMVKNALYILLIIGALYFGLSEVIHLPYVQEVVGSIQVVEGVLGSALGISTANWKSNLNNK